jgi:hypothetical protein
MNGFHPCVIQSLIKRETWLVNYPQNRNLVPCTSQLKIIIWLEVFPANWSHRIPRFVFHPQWIRRLLAVTIVEKVHRIELVGYFQLERNRLDGTAGGHSIWMQQGWTTL